MPNQNAESVEMIDNRVINAIWHAIFDILDKDGTRSIFEYANLPQLTDEVLKDGKSKITTLLKVLFAMRDLLQYSPNILLEIGKKFSFYLDPTGSNLDDFIKMLNDSMIGTSFTCEKVENNTLIVEISANIGKNGHTLLEDDWLMYFYEGIFTGAFLKGIGGSMKIEIVDKKYNCCKFKIQSDTQICNP